MSLAPTSRAADGWPSIAPAPDVFERLHQVIAEEKGASIHIRLELDSERGWSCELRYTPDSAAAASWTRSFSLFAVRGCSPSEVLERVLDDLEAIPTESGRRMIT